MGRRESRVVGRTKNEAGAQLYIWIRAWPRERAGERRCLPLPFAVYGKTIRKTNDKWTNDKWTNGMKGDRNRRTRENSQGLMKQLGGGRDTKIRLK
jgi:hypothetical protein